MKPSYYRDFHRSCSGIPAVVRHLNRIFAARSAAAKIIIRSGNRRSAARAGTSIQRCTSIPLPIANNVAIDHLRKRQIPTISMDGSPHAGTAEAVESTRFEIADQSESALAEME